MNKVSSLFLEALHASLENKSVQWNMELTTSEWITLFQMAEAHHVLPMIFEAVFRCPAAAQADAQLFIPYKKKTRQLVTMQILKTAEFLSMYAYLRKENIKPLVVKGLICRNLYPKPDNRMSSDEDLWITPETFGKCHRAMLDYGMYLMDSEEFIRESYEVSYGKKGTSAYIELHKSLFPPESSVYGDFNRFFEESQARAVEVEVQGISVFTLEYTDHLFYLICHAFKHFLHSGFGLRQVCDVLLFSSTYGEKIDWTRLFLQCDQIRAVKFTVALFQIGKKYFSFSEEKAGYPACWKEIEVDEQPMLEDLLQSGIYGKADKNRTHSSNMTLEAVLAQKSGRKTSHSLIKTVFPSAKNLQGRFPYLRKYPWLLPIAWIARILKYHGETRTNDGTSAAGSIKIGNQRVELLKQYDILEK